MTPKEQFGRVVKVLATIALLTQGMHYATTQPGSMDVFNAGMAALAVLAIWRY